MLIDVKKKVVLEGSYYSRQGKRGISLDMSSVFWTQTLRCVYHGKIHGVFHLYFIYFAMCSYISTKSHILKENLDTSAMNRKKKSKLHKHSYYWPSDGFAFKYKKYSMKQRQKLRYLFAYLSLLVFNWYLCKLLYTHHLNIVFNN